MSAEMPARIRLYAREWGEVRPGDDPADFPNTVEFVRADIADGLLEAAQQAVAILRNTGAPGWGKAKDILNTAIARAEAG